MIRCHGNPGFINSYLAATTTGKQGMFISSPEPSGSTGELIVYPCSGVHRQCRRHPPVHSETAWPVKAIFHVEPPWEGGTKVYLNGQGHMTEMAAMPIYVKTFKYLLLWNQKSYDLESWHATLGT